MVKDTPQIENYAYKNAVKKPFTKKITAVQRVQQTPAKPVTQYYISYAQMAGSSNCNNIYS